MDKYDHWLPKLFMKFNHAPNWAVTIGQTTYYSVTPMYVAPSWRRHEDTHKKQWADEGFFKFLLKYLFFNITRGYMNNPYEIEARATEERLFPTT